MTGKGGTLIMFQNVPQNIFLLLTTTIVYSVTVEQLVQRLTDSESLVVVRRPDAGYQALPPDHSLAMRSHPVPPLKAKCLQTNLAANNHESDE